MRALRKVVDSLYLSVFLLILCFVMGTIYLQSVWLLAIVPLLVVLIYAYLRKQKRLWSDAVCKQVWYAASIFCFFMLLFVSFTCGVCPLWDWGFILQSASDYVLYGTLDKLDYYARYPNNQFFLIAITTLFHLVKWIYPQADFAVFHTVSVVVSCLFIWLTIQIIYATAKELWGVRQAALAGIVATGCLPLYMYAQFFYTDTVGMLLFSLLLFVGVKLYRQTSFRKRIAFAALLGTLAGFTYHIKVIPYILFIGIIIAELLHKRGIKEKLLVVSLLLLCCGMSQFAVGAYSDSTAARQFGVTEELKEYYEYPLTHWVMMGLNTETDGGYNVDDVVYTVSFHTMKERKEENKKVIQERLEDFGTVGYLEFILQSKLPRTWGNSCFGGNDYLARQPMYEDWILVQLLSQDGRYHEQLSIYTWFYYVAMLIGMILSGIMALIHWREDDALQAGRIALLGLALFQMLWECNSRYLVTFIPLMIILAMDGYYHMKDWKLSKSV